MGKAVAGEAAEACSSCDNWLKAMDITNCDVREDSATKNSHKHEYDAMNML
jgi:hypothetical protein